MQEKEIMTDLLTVEKMLAWNYSTFATECATQSVRTDVMNLLNDQHKIQAEVFDLMASKGWYPTEPAEQQKIDKAKQKFMSQGN